MQKYNSNLIYKLALAILIFFGPHSTSAQGVDLRVADYLDRTREGRDQLLQLNYDEAEQIFEQLQQDYPEHPGPLYYEAVIVWQRELFRRDDLELNKFTSPSYFAESESTVQMPEQTRKRFFDNAQRSIEASKAILAKNSDHLDARYFLGAIKGVLASFALTIDHDKTEAFDKGKEAFEIHKKLIEDNPDYYSAYVSVGLYEYVADNLPWYIKWLAVLAGYSGDEEKGLEYLRTAADKSLFADDSATILLMVLLTREEEYSEALERATWLHKNYSKNYLFHINRAQILKESGQRQRALEVYSEIQRLAENARPNYQKLNLDSFYHQFGVLLLEAGEAEEARSRLEKVIHRSPGDKKILALSHLYLGQALDLLNDRSKAVQQYRKVLEYEPFDDSHDRAEDYLEEPYRG